MPVFDTGTTTPYDNQPEKILVGPLTHLQPDLTVAAEENLSLWDLVELEKASGANKGHWVAYGTATTGSGAGVVMQAINLTGEAATKVPILISGGVDRELMITAPSDTEDGEMIGNLVFLGDAPPAT